MYDIQTDCPKCSSNNAISCYGGERGETGPWIFCDDCGYDEEYIQHYNYIRNINVGNNNKPL